MPIYEYACVECGHEFDALQKMSDAPLTQCPACHQEGLEKKVSAPGFRLSGSGWYETDFKSRNQKNLANSDSAASDSKSTGSGSKSETSSKDAGSQSSTKPASKEVAA